MGRAKLTMELIKSENNRRYTFKKRKGGLEKKASELSTLCGVDVCLIVYAPKLDDHPTIWPNPQKLEEMIARYRNKSIDDSKKRTLNLFNFYEDRKKKLQDALMKLRRKSIAIKYPTWDDRFNLLSEEQLRELGKIITNKLEIAIARFELLQGTKFGTSTARMMEGSSSQVHPQPKNYPYFMQGALVRKRSFEVEVFQQHPNSLMNPNELDKSIHFPYNDPNPMVSPMMTMLMGENDCSSQYYGASSSNMVYGHGSFYSDPMAGTSMVENMVMNSNPRPQPPPHCYYDPAMQQAQPYMQYQVMPSGPAQMHASHMEEYYQFYGLQTKNEKLGQGRN